jgi:hypothetical protein
MLCNQMANAINLLPAKDVAWEISKSTATESQMDLPEGHSVFTMVPRRGKTQNSSKSESTSDESVSSQYLRAGKEPYI